MAFTIASDLILPLIMGDITGIIQQEGGFEYGAILSRVLLCNVK